MADKKEEKRMGAVSKRRTIEEIFLQSGLLNEETLKKAQDESKKTDEVLQQSILDANLATKAEILRVLSREWRVRAVDLSEMDIDPDVGKILPKQLAKQKVVIPFAKEEGMMLLAMRDPRDVFAVEDIQLRFGIQVIPYLAMPSDIRSAISKVHGEEEMQSGASEDEEEEKEKQAQSQLSQVDLADEAQEMTRELLEGLGASAEVGTVEVDKGAEVEDIMQVDTSAPEVEKLVNAIILEALRLKASDIHIEPFEKKLLVRYRVDGALRKSTFKVPFIFRNALMAKIKIMGE